MSESGRASRRFRWRLFAFIAIHALIGVHLFLWYKLGFRPFGSIGLEELFRTFIQRGILNAGALLFLALILLSFLWGRAFCGWGCHIGIIYDLFDRIYAKFPRRKWFVGTGWILAAFILIYFFLRPALLIRNSQPPGTNMIQMVETEPWATLPGWIMSLIIFTTIFIILPAFFGKRAFCKLLCPWGILLGALNRFSFFKIRKVASCSFCGSCTQVCPMDIDVSKAINSVGAVNSHACTGCMMCVDVCGDRTLAFTKKSSQVPVNAREGTFHEIPPTLPPANRSFRFVASLTSIGTRRVFFVLTSIAVGLVYSEIYGFGHFLAFCTGVTVAAMSVLILWRARNQLKIVGYIFLMLLWSVVVKDGLAHYHYNKGLKDFAMRQWQSSQYHLEQSDRFFWYPPTELYLKLYTIYKGTGQSEKQEAIRLRYDQRKNRKRKS